MDGGRNLEDILKANRLNMLCRPDLKMYKLWIGFVVQSVSSRILLTSDRKWAESWGAIMTAAAIQYLYWGQRSPAAASHPGCWLLSGAHCCVLESGRCDGWRPKVSTKIRGTQYSQKVPTGHITSLKDHHWLPVCEVSQYQVEGPCFNACTYIIVSYLI